MPRSRKLEIELRSDTNVVEENDFIHAFEHVTRAINTGATSGKVEFMVGYTIGGSPETAYYKGTWKID